MSVRFTPWVSGLLAALFGAVFAWYVRLPLPFDGFAALAAAGLAFWATLTFVAWMPSRWVWTEAERLRHAFQARHNISDAAAGSALKAITTAHARANTLRAAASTMREDVADRVHALADRLDVAAREIFYAPQRQREISAVLIRSELIEDAALAHAKLRKRNQAETEDASRTKLIAAVDALDAAFDDSDLLAARDLLAEVEVASEVAETVLKPRRRIPTRPLT
ncbi:MAG: hypothetical protein AAFQ58_09495 [Pseudomonadota bacterium]